MTYLVTEGKLTDENYHHAVRPFLDRLAAAIRYGINLVQIREKSLSARNLFELAAAGAKLTAGSDTLLMINDRADIALAAGAAGVHLTENSIKAQFLRSRFPSEFVIGVSIHSTADIGSAESDGADFAVFGPVFETPGKGEPRGIDALRSAVTSAPQFPVLAIGGIDASNYRSALEAGAAGFASIRFLNDRSNWGLMRVNSEQTRPRP